MKLMNLHRNLGIAWKQQGVPFYGLRHVDCFYRDNDLYEVLIHVCMFVYTAFAWNMHKQECK